MKKIIKNKISCIIPSYRGADFLPLALESFLSQDYPCKEAVVIIQKDREDSSYDKIINLYGNIPQCKMLIFEQSFFPSKARNIGIYESSGDFICILDDDDSLEDCCYFSKALKIFGNDKKVGILTPKSLSSLDKNIIYRTGDSMRLDRFNFSHSGSIIRRNLLSRIDFYKEQYKFYEDLDLFLRMSEISSIVVSDSYVLKNLRTTSMSYKSSSLDEFNDWFKVARPYILNIQDFFGDFLKKAVRQLFPENSS